MSGSSSLANKCKLMNRNLLPQFISLYDFVFFLPLHRFLISAIYIHFHYIHLSHGTCMSCCETCRKIPRKWIKNERSRIGKENHKKINIIASLLRLQVDDIKFSFTLMTRALNVYWYTINWNGRIGLVFGISTRLNMSALQTSNVNSNKISDWWGR